MRDAVKKLNEKYKTYKPVDQEMILNAPNNESNKTLSMFARLMKPKQVFEYSQNNTEIKAYLKESQISNERNKNILLWWKANKSVYPEIS